MSRTARDYRICSFCVMDSTNPAIQFDDAGQCDCCRDALARRPHEWWPGPDGKDRMHKMADQLRSHGRGKDYDVMIGLSGGVDSAYLAHLAVRKLGLRVLAVHVDGGWNSEPAVHNIEALVRKLDLDLYTYVVEWQEMRDLQLAFLKASVLNQDIPQDHAFFSTLYNTAAKFHLRHFLSGVNFASEGVVSPLWGYPYTDAKHARAIHARFGSIPLRTFPFMGLMTYIWMTKVRRQLTIHYPLNYIAYDKRAVQEELLREYGWRDYGGKHCESRFTKFYQEIYLPQKFGFDKRRLHLASLIVSGQITRDEAIKILEQPVATPAQIRFDIRFVAKKLSLTEAELQTLINNPTVDHLEYPNQLSLYRRLKSAKFLLRRASRVRDVASRGLGP